MGQTESRPRFFYGERDRVCDGAFNAIVGP